ncbi:site-specific DNA-methyltransferase [Chitinophaga nivalis]|uniref:site-specific DNA-methyltransferase (adenine-specific) n=1 Tax=Chitinophaga nivalis TaxID=2991709 RepID=A0ABT3IE94_9BACT|nr:site-specific DNA-methyltransferase [Chitinophaga nivalis]MCW3468031.1 site-specific DNA-methyltransferase [Chitinophaga nivalis]MCW3482278.1 site-specific DNA-methyltransferase [Chitinophaga nivalis]
MEGTSLNIAADIRQRLKEMIPGAFTENKIDIVQLKQLLGEMEDEDATGERYQLDWAGKTAAYKTLQTPVTDTLIPDIADSVNWDTANNVLIEGDNLDVLKVIQKSYYGKVKAIIIDPPYNTGSDSFIYPDRFGETKAAYLQRLGEKDDAGFMQKEGLFRPNRKENGQFHSNWLSMMLPRLFLARNVLKEEGAIVIHIDEHEQANLTLLLNEVFGEENQVGNMVWDKGNPKGDAGGIAYQHESILVYAKNKEKFLSATALTRKKKNAERMLKKAAELYKQLNQEEVPEEVRQLHKIYGLPDEVLARCRRKNTLEEINRQFNGWLKKQPVTGGELAYNKIDEAGQVYRLVSMAWPNKKKAPDDYFVPLIHPVTQKPCPVPQRGWRFPTTTIKELLDRGEIIFGADESVQPQRKYLLKNNLSENLPSILFYGGSDDDLLRKLGLEFENPKPVDFTRSLVQAFTQPDQEDIVLDFFAGSGTTAHAVMAANQQDGGNRRFLCIQLPEQLDEKSEMYKKSFRTIADLTRNRIKSVIAGEQDTVTGIRFYKLAPSNFNIWRSDLIENEADLVAQLQLFSRQEKQAAPIENMLWELLIKQGCLLTERIVKEKVADTATFYVTADNKTAFCLDTYNEAVQQALLQRQPATVICLDTLFNQDDCYKTNSQLSFRDHKIGFKTV